MKINPYLLSLVYTMLFSCSKQMENTNTPTLSSYFEPTSKGIQTGGVQLIPLIEGKDTFSLWTKRIGNNPKIKVLLLNGGPGATHEYFECFENFYLKKALNSYIMINWELGILPIQWIPLIGTLPDM